MPISNDERRRRPAAEVMVEIHERVDMALIVKLTNTIKDHIEIVGPIKNNVISATFAYMLADAISQADDDERICLLSETYGEYVHHCAHGMYEAHEELDVEERLQ